MAFNLTYSFVSSRIILLSFPKTLSKERHVWNCEKTLTATSSFPEENQLRQSRATQPEIMTSPVFAVFLRSRGQAITQRDWAHRQRVSTFCEFIKFFLMVLTDSNSGGSESAHFVNSLSFFLMVLTDSNSGGQRVSTFCEFIQFFS